MSSFFSKTKSEFDEKYSNQNTFDAFLPVGMDENRKEIPLKDKNGGHNEEYYKWQFLYSLVYSGMYPKDYIGTEVRFPKGTSDIRFDGAVFKEKEWFEHYKEYHNHTNGSQEALDWLRRNLIAVIEIKKEGIDVEKVWNEQLKSYLKESESDFCLGILYNKERLYLFQQTGGGSTIK